MATSTDIRATTLTAFFDERYDAEDAVSRLVENGIPRANISMVAGSESEVAPEEEHRGFWAALKDFFLPEEDRYAYAEGLRRGGYLVTVSGITGDRYDAAVDILDDEGAIDFDARTREWTASGWTGYRAQDSDLGTSAVRAEDNAAGETVIPVAREELRVGKRDVNLGRVRVRSYVAEDPVSETVNLRDERVIVDRRPVDRTAADADAFRDRVIEAEEHAEEPVIQKDARIVEEVTLRKQVDSHNETVSDTVRHTEVEIEDDRDTVRRDRSA